MNEAIIFDVSSLLSKTTGESEVYSFEGSVKLEGIDFKSGISGKVEIMRIDEGVNIAARNIETKVSLKCEKCLKKFTQNINIDLAERQFLLEKPKVIEDLNDLFLIDKKRMKIDLSEMLRQEIILHFPVNSVCSTRCKGICPKCGKDLNKGKCNCKKEDLDTTSKPLAGLKKLLEK